MLFEFALRLGRGGTLEEERSYRMMVRVGMVVFFFQVVEYILIEERLPL
jgi:hypothetical protein